MLEVVRIDIGSGGLPQCARCGASGVATYRSSIEVIGDIAAVAAGPGTLLMLGGAEAFGHSALPEIIGAAASAGYRRIGLQTAGGLLAVGGNAAGVLHAGVRHFEIVYVPSDSLPSGPDHGAPLQGVRELVAAASAARTRIAVSAVIPACRHCIEALPAAVADLAAAGVGSVSIVAERGSCTGPRALAAVIAACDTGIVNAVWVEVRGIELPDGHSMHRAEEAIA